MRAEDRGRSQSCQEDFPRGFFRVIPRRREGGEVPVKGRRGAPTAREWTLLYSETRRKHLVLPLFHARITGK